MKNYLLSFHSEILSREVPVRLLVPAGKNMKCLILLHGYNGTQDQWLDKSPIKDLAEMFNLVVAMPGCGNGYYEDIHEDMPRFVGEELVSFLQSSLPISSCRENLYIGGVSMGGFGALLIGSKYHKTFGKIVSFSGAFIIPDVVIGNQGVLGNADPQYFRDIFGDFETLEGSNRDPIAEAIRVSTMGVLPSLCLLCGAEDALYQCNVNAVKTLRNHKVSVLWYGGKGNHRWPFWSNVLPYVIRWLVDDYIPDGVDQYASL